MRVDPDDDSRGGRLRRAVRWQMDHLDEVPAIILCCGQRDWPFAVPSEERVGPAPPSYGSVYPCVQNMLLACRALGLGATLTTMHQLFPDALADRFAIPDEYGVVVMMPIGYPMGRFGPVRRHPIETKVHYGRWGATRPDA